MATKTGYKGLMQGQQLDLLYPRSANPEKLKKINYLKTSQLFILALTAGAKIKFATQKEINALENFGRYFGLFFQIYDDLKDINQDKVKVNFVKEKQNLMELGKKSLSFLKIFEGREKFFIKLIEYLQG